METATLISVEIVLLPEHCYRCQRVTAPVIGLRIPYATIDDGEHLVLDEDGGWFLEYDSDTAELIATACPEALLRAHGSGPLHWRTTRSVPDGYLANTCHHCGAVLGNWPLNEAFVEYQVEGGTISDLPRIGSAIDELILVQL
jgi:hypothetical protein